MCERQAEAGLPETVHLLFCSCKAPLMPILSSSFLMVGVWHRGSKQFLSGGVGPERQVSGTPITQRNRPFSAVNVVDGSGGALKKAAAEKALTVLHEAGRAQASCEFEGLH